MKEREREIHGRYLILVSESARMEQWSAIELDKRGVDLINGALRTLPYCAAGYSRISIPFRIMLYSLSVLWNIFESLTIQLLLSEHYSTNSSTSDPRANISLLSTCFFPLVHFSFEMIHLSVLFSSILACSAFKDYGLPGWACEPQVMKR